jgi:hypothetical protein
MTSIAWKFNRIRLMGIAEVVWRVRQFSHKKTGQLGFGLAKSPPIPNTNRFGACFLSSCANEVNQSSIKIAADKLLDGNWDIFSLKNISLGFPPIWNQDPKTGKLAPITYGKAIDYRDETTVGDIKYLWESSRHLELVTLAMAWRTTDDKRYINGAREFLTSWLQQCPYPNGVHWTSALESAIRLLNWACSWQLLGGFTSKIFEGPPGQQLMRAWLDSIYQHCHFINSYFSLHSSANNHLLGEYMGLFVASLNWPCWAESSLWLKKAQKGLEEEAVHQNFPDGVNKEQAVYYQHEVMDMMLLCHLIGRANGVKLSPAFLGQLEKLAEFLASIMDLNGNVPMIGDADDASMVRLSYEPDWCRYRSLLASSAILFSRAEFKNKAKTIDDKNKWLFGSRGILDWEAIDSGVLKPLKTAYSDGGYYLLGSRFSNKDEVKIIADCGPLGYLSIAAHGHADALAFTLSVKGEEFLIDPGTYAYHTQKSWRNYFRGTAAHNTVRVDRKDQSEIAGNFMWSHKASATLLTYSADNELSQVFEGAHDGYQRLNDPVTHRRKLQYNRSTQILTVTDTLLCKERHYVEVFWHFAEHCEVFQNDGHIKASASASALELYFDGKNFETLLYHGSEAPIAGWISRSFDTKSPTYTACFFGYIDGTTQLTTKIQLVDC